jgi:hypothetical protein
MELRTTFSIPPSSHKITYDDPVMFIGSCFAGSIGSKLEAGRMHVMINPSGTVYNPVSVASTLTSVIENRKYTEEDLHDHKGTWLSFDHYTDFSSGNKQEVLGRINRNTAEASEFLSQANFLFITFGTARVFRHLASGRIVSNCHKITASEFKRELLTVDEIAALWKRELDRLQSFNQGLKVVFTISPVRHWKDGPHGNQLSKSVLFLAVEELLAHPSLPQYFPAYELVMDDLRDYRFYTGDMLHLSEAAIDYIWNVFSGCYFDSDTIETWREAEKIIRAVSHRIRKGAGENIRSFAESMLKKIDILCARRPVLDLSSERNYFEGLAGN